MFSKMLVAAVNTTWQQIGDDALDGCMDEPDNEGAVEMCLDADRIVMYGGEEGKAAQEEFRARSKVIGYSKALTELAEQLSLM